MSTPRLSPMIPLRNLLRNRVRSLLTIAGAAVGIAVFVSLTIISKGFRSQIEDVIGSYNIDITVQSSGAATPLGSSISLEDYKKLGSLQGVREVYSLVIGPIKTKWNPYMLIFGISSAEAFASKVGMLEGRMPEKGRGEVAIGELFARRFDYRVGNKIMLTDSEIFSITGIFSSESKLVSGSVMLDTDDARRILKRYDSVNLVFVQVRKGTAPSTVAESINRGFPALNALRSGDFVGQMRLIRVVDAASWAVSTIALLAACIVVMNTLIMAVSERTKEIGILMAIGWSRYMIMKTIVTEALLICFVGSLAGNVLGVLQLSLFNYLDPEGMGLWTANAWSPGVLLRSAGISLVMGIISSLYPALLSTRLLPAEALRHE